MTSGGVPAALLRGGTSKGLFLLAADLPADPAERDDLLLRLMGSPDPAQIDGVGGAVPVTSKVAVVAPSDDPEHDVDYLFLQVGVDAATVSDRQNCGNLLAAVGQFAVGRGLVAAGPERTAVRIRMVNSGATAVSRFATPGGRVDFTGTTAIAGVPGTAAPVLLDMLGTEGSTTGALLPTGRVADRVDGLDVTCVDNGMPVVVVRAADLGLTGHEPPAELAADAGLTARVDALRIRAGALMGLGDVRDAPVPKTTLVAPPRTGGAIGTRTFIPVRPHPAIGVLGAVSVVTAGLLDGSVAHDLLDRGTGGPLAVEHPSGSLEVDVEIAPGDPPRVLRSTVVRTARMLFDGVVFPRA
ncbi:4-oxalomesaconate tautomerase [Pseudonocardia sp. HH130630-07]|uniref:4-oxalomesaconate tautomerase n=1 Tax=Pseudonocardia sp. HH130630-07 TaxID=1690815 RepID=UPI000814F11A|nr:4-oxalomesaconate tautomerase [Pseudonocardia sp. HH130630-07]ANY06191.1 FldA protein [Pseudonocardia sp. HH130630-07]